MADGNDGQVFGDHMGLFTLRFRALGPLLPKGCTMGAGNTPASCTRSGRAARTDDRLGR